MFFLFVLKLHFIISVRYLSSDLQDMICFFLQDKHDYNNMQCMEGNITFILEEKISKTVDNNMDALVSSHASSFFWHVG